MSEGQSNDVHMVGARQRGAGPSRGATVKTRQPARRTLPERQQQQQQAPDFVIDLTHDLIDEDDVQIMQVKNVKRQRTSHGAAGLGQPAALAAQPPAPPQSPKGYKCTICLERMESNMATTQCGHMFCYKCISDWVQRSGNCPQCRTKLTKSKIIRLYPPT